MSEPLSKVGAKQATRSIVLSNGASIVYTKHALVRMKQRNVLIVDVLNVLRGGWCDLVEWENGAWRYRMTTHTIKVVVEIEVDDSELVIITVMRVSR